MAQKKVKKTGLNLYRVTFYYHTNGCVDVKASSEEEALKLADGGDVPNEELLEGLQEDNSPDAELIEANVEPDPEPQPEPENKPKRIRIVLEADEMYVADTLHLLGSIVENDDILEPLYEGEVSEVTEEECSAKFTVAD